MSSTSNSSATETVTNTTNENYHQEHVIAVTANGNDLELANAAPDEHQQELKIFKGLLSIYMYIYNFWMKLLRQYFVGIPIEDDRSPNDRLYEAARKGDWRTAESIEKLNPGILSRVICDDREETALHIATRAKKASFVEKLVVCIGANDLALKNKYENTALCIAASSGAVNIAKLMVAKNHELPLIRGFGNVSPVLIAARYKHKDMLSYLLSVMHLSNFNENEAVNLLAGAIYADFYDIALDILQWNENLAVERDVNRDTALHIMARKSIGISSRKKPTMWHRCFKFMNKNIMMQVQARQVVECTWKRVILEMKSEDEMLGFIKHPTNMLHDAAKVGNDEFLRVLINSKPDLPWKIVEDDEKMITIFHIAVENRQLGVFSLIYEMGDSLDYLPRYFDENKTSLLELAAKKPDENHDNRDSGTAFQIHQELLLFKEVEKIVELTMTRKIGDNKPRELFSQQQKKLMKQGDKWKKEIGNSCILVATGVFATAFTVSVGYNDNLDFVNEKVFTIYVISDAIAIISSATSILLFLSILISHYEEEEFLFALPVRLVYAAATLFISVLSMVVAFGANFYMLYYNATARVPLIIAVMAVLPIFCFVVLRSKLMTDKVAAIWATEFFLQLMK